MKHKQTELDVDFIGGEGPLTKAEVDGISQYIRKHKVAHLKPSKKGKRSKSSSIRKKKLTA